MEQENQETQKEVEDWRSDVSEAKSTLKLADGESVVVTFLDEGTRKTHVDFGTSVVFKVKVLDAEEERLWYVNAQNYNLLGQLKELGTLTNVKAKISRTGSKRSDTRYSVEKS